jgi:hypothetical protein
MYRSSPSKVYCKCEFEIANYTIEWMTTYCIGQVQQPGLNQNGVVHNPIRHFTVTLSRSPKLYCFQWFYKHIKRQCSKILYIFIMSPNIYPFSIHPPFVIFSCAYITGSCYTTTTFSYLNSHVLPLAYTPMKRSKLSPFQSSGDSFCCNSSVTLLIQWLLYLNAKQSKLLEQNES